MDVAELARRLEAARTFEHTIGSITYRVRMPARTETARALAEMRELVQADENSPETADKLLAAIAPRVLGMVGATSADVCIPGPVEPLDDSPESARLVLAEKLEHAAQLLNELSTRLVQRNASLQADRKN